MLEKRIDRVVKIALKLSHKNVLGSCIWGWVERGNELGSRTASRGTKTCLHISCLHAFTYREYHIAGQTTSDYICRELHDCFEKVFTRESGLSSAQFDTFGAIKAA